MPTERTWQDWLERFYNLRRDKSGSHERPHKPVLLLAILNLVDRGIVTRNVEIYDYRCAACGIRVKISDDLSLVEAAHIIPFGVSRNDKPDNGLALCANHHWAMDRFLIAPCPDSKHRAGIWRIGQSLDARIEGRNDLVTLANQPVIPPTEQRFCPAPESLRWRETHFNAKY